MEILATLFTKATLWRKSWQVGIFSQYFDTPPKSNTKLMVWKILLLSNIAISIYFEYLC